jgi:MFS family permease
MVDMFRLTPLTYIVILGAAISNYAMGILDPIIALYLQTLGVGSDRIGTIISARFLITAIGSLPLALFASSIGITKFLFLSGISAGLAGIILMTFQGANGVWLFFIIIGISQAANSGPGAVVLAENTGTKRLAAFALFSSTWMIPPALGAATAFIWFRNVVEETAEVYASIFILVFIFLLISGVVYTVLLMNSLKRGHTISQESNKKVAIKRQFTILLTPAIVIPFLMLSGVQFMMGAGAGATLPFLPLYLSSLNAYAWQISLLTMILNLLMGIATQLSAPLAKIFGDLQVFVVCTGLSVICLLGIVFSNDLMLSSLFFILRGVFANMTAPIGQSRMIDFVENSVRATGSAWISSSRWIGWTIFSPISGRIIDDFGFEVSFVFTAFLYVIATALFVYVIQKFQTVDQLKETNKWPFN